MNKTTFHNDDDVKGFVDWLVKTLPQLPVCLDFKKSRFVPKGIKAKCIGLDAVLQKYWWESAWIDSVVKPVKSNNWSSTKFSLDRLAAWLRSETGRMDDRGTFDACMAVLQWGGDRNPQHGATVFLSGLRPDLPDYLINARADLWLNAAKTNSFPDVKKMNSMLTKIHALLSGHGLPIYDSRVAASIATLVEMYRQAMKPGWTKVPDPLKFPATISVRSVYRYDDHAFSHGLMNYGNPQQTAISWCSAKIRLGWILEAVLQKVDLFPNEPEVKGRQPLMAKMHAFEAALFMIGYDVACLKCKGVNAFNTGTKRKIQSQRSSLSERLGKLSRKTTRTLIKGHEFTYFGNCDTGYRIDYDKSPPIIIEPDLIEELLNELGGQGWVLAGFTKGSPAQGSFSASLEDLSAFSGVHASRIAAVLAAEGLARYRRTNRASELEF